MSKVISSEQPAVASFIRPFNSVDHGTVGSAEVEQGSTACQVHKNAHVVPPFDRKGETQEVKHVIPQSQENVI